MNRSRNVMRDHIVHLKYLQLVYNRILPGRFRVQTRNKPIIIRIVGGDIKIINDENNNIKMYVYFLLRFVFDDFVDATHVVPSY